MYRLMEKLKAEDTKSIVMRWIAAIISLAREGADFYLRDKMMGMLIDCYLKDLNQK